jgi:hypothetical protein
MKGYLLHAICTNLLQNGCLHAVSLAKILMHLTKTLRAQRFLMCTEETRAKLTLYLLKADTFQYTQFQLRYYQCLVFFSSEIDHIWYWNLRMLDLLTLPKYALLNYRKVAVITYTHTTCMSMYSFRRFVLSQYAERSTVIPQPISDTPAQQLAIWQWNALCSTEHASSRHDPCQQESCGKGRTTDRSRNVVVNGVKVLMFYWRLRFRAEMWQNAKALERHQQIKIACTKKLRTD